MTAIWDRLGSIAASLIEDGTAMDEKKAEKLVDCMLAVYLSIKDRPEYPLKLLELLKVNVDPTIKPTLLTVGYLDDCIQMLHDFDHMDLPTEFGKTYGHHTEQLIARKRANKAHAKVLAEIHSDSYWDY